MAFFDEDLNFIGGTGSSDAARERALRTHQAAMKLERQRGGRIEYGDNRHHRAYIRMKTDEALYQAGMLRIDEMHRDCDPTEDFKLVRIARDCISLDGSIPPPADQRAECLHRAATGSATFTDLLDDIANKSLILGYGQANLRETWPALVNIRPTKDFRPFDVNRGAAIQTPPEVPEFGELKAAKIADDGKEQSQVKSYVERITFTRQAMLNDDLDALMLNPARAGAAVSRLLGDLVIGALTANAALGDGVALFHADHGNLATSGAAPAVTTLEGGYLAMSQQADALGQVLNIIPRFVLASPTRAATIAVLRGAVNTYDDPESNLRITALVDGRLAGLDPWYLLADPKLHSGLDLFVLAGTENRPRLERMTNAPKGAPDGIHYKLGYDAACVVADYRALYQNPGA